MKEILLTSSVLILALLLLRVLFRSAVSRRVQYALWLLVLVRLLVPGHLPAVNFSLLTAAEPVGQAVSAALGALGETGGLQLPHGAAALIAALLGYFRLRDCHL